MLAGLGVCRAEEQKKFNHPKVKFMPYFGASVGGGMETSLYMTEGDKHDWLLAINSDGLNRPLGPRLYFGIIFTH